MAIKRYVLKGDQKPTPSQIAEVRKAASRPIVYDEDCPRLTDEQLAQFYRVADRQRSEKEKNNKQSISLRLSPWAIQKAKALGKGYTTVLSGILEMALDNPAFIEELNGKV